LRIAIVAVGRARDGPERALFRSYVERLPWGVKLVEVEAKGRASGAAELKQREAELLLAAMPDGALAIALDERGRQFSSAAFAERLGRWRDEGVEPAFLIGGADGLGEAVRRRAALLLSLGAMTWPHMLARAMLAEQLWRAHAILSGHPYHRA
jgi:23S rRNA (pseudouridine1915-N3)-methyltransferase